MSDTGRVKSVFIESSNTFNDDIKESALNVERSPVFEILNVSINFGVYETLMRILHGREQMSKDQWKIHIWRVAWKMEDKHRALIGRTEVFNLVVFK